MCSYPLQRGNVIALFSSYLVNQTCRVRQGKSTPHPCWTIKITQTDRNHLSSTKNWGLLILAPLLHSSEERSFFTELGFSLTTQKMTTYSCRIGLVNPLLLYPSLLRDNKCNTCNTCYLQRNQSLSFPFLHKFTFLKWRI